MADDDRVGTIRENVATIRAEIHSINEWMAKFDRCLEETATKANKHDTEISGLKTDIALLKDHSIGEKDNWDKIWDVLKPVIVAVVVAVVMTVMK